MNKTKLFTAIAAAVGMGWGIGVQATPQIGINLTGGGIIGVPGTYTYVDTLTQNSETGVDVNSGQAVGSFTPGDVHRFHTQARVAVGSVSGGPNLLPLYDAFPTLFTQQLTKVTAIKDAVTGYTTDPVAGTNTVTFGFISQDPGNQLTWYVDNVTDGSQAVAGTSPPGSPPNSNVNSAKCYGTGDNTVGPPVDCGTAAGGFDGVPVLTAKLIADTSSFTFNNATGIGTGQFNLTYQITSPSNAYIDLSNFPNGGPVIFSEVWTGTLALPLLTQFPQYMQDGTPSASNIAANSLTPKCTAAPGFPANEIATCAADGNVHSNFQIDGSERFNFQTPEPSSLALLGAGLLGLGNLYRRKKG